MANVFDLYASLSLDSKQYEQGLKNAQSSAKGFGGKLSKAFKVAGKAFAGVSTAVGGAAGALSAVSKKSADTADRVDKMSQKLGISREAFQELDFICSQSGTSVDSLKMGMKTLTSQMGKASDESSDTAKMFKSLGVEVTDSNGKLKSQEEVFFDVVSALQGVENQTEKASMANKLLGRSGTELMPLLNSEAGSMEAMKKQAHDLGLVMDDETVDAGVKLTDTIDQLQRSFGAIVTRVGAKVMPLIQKAADYVIKNIPKIKKVFEKAFDVMADVVTNAIDIAKDFWENLKNMAEYISDEFSPVVDALGGLFEALGEFLSPVIDYFKDYVESGDAAEDSTNLFKDAISALSDGLEFVITKLTDFVTWLNDGSTASDVFKAVIVGITGAFATYKAIVIATTLATKAQALATVVAEGATKAMTVAQGALNAVMNANPLAIVAIAVVGLVTALVTLYNTNEDFRKLVQKVWATIKKTVLGVIDALKKGFESWVFIIQQVWGKIKTTLSPVAEWIGDKFTTAVDNIKNAFSGVVGFFKGIWKGIKGAFSKVTDWFKTTFQTAWEGVKNVFTTGGKVFEGIKEGILSVFKTVVNGLIGGINKVIKVPFEGINKALKAIKNVKIGPAKPFKGLISLIDVPEIPKLARGGVIEPNNPFLAMLGDQKSGVNIETPLDTMVDAFNQSLDSRRVDDEGIRLLRGIYGYLEAINLSADIRDAVQGLEFKADNRELARVVKKYA